MNRVARTNIAMAIGLAVNVGLALFPLGWLYLLAIVIYKNIAPFIAMAMLIFGVMTFKRVKRDVDIDAAFLFLGAIGGVIAVNTVSKDYSGREKIYSSIWTAIWIFIIYPAVIYMLLAHTNIWWLPSV